VAPPVAGVPEPWSLAVWCVLAATFIVGRIVWRARSH
jgi:hypothetical protein